MERFRATSVKEDVVELATTKDLEKLYEVIENEQNFILEWDEEGVAKSEVIIGNNLVGKVKNGDVRLASQEKGE